MDLRKDVFNELIESYKQLPTQIKKNEIINEIENIISIYSKLCTKLNIIPDVEQYKQILNINKSDLSDEEFLTILFSYLEALKDVSGQFIDGVSNLIDNM